MQKFYLLNLFLIVSFFLGGCDLLPFGIESEPDDQITETTPPPENNNEEPQEAEKEEEEIARSPASPVSGLQQASDPDEFVRQRGDVPGQQRDDPFGFFPVSSDKITRVEPEPEEPEPETTEDPTPKPPPEPELARGIQIQGALRINGNQTVAIIKAPNEPTSRHVRAGELIAQDQVLVKEIDLYARPNPIVVLEELGINQEVRKEVTGEVAFGNSETTIGNNPTSPLPPPPPLGDS